MSPLRAKIRVALICFCATFPLYTRVSCQANNELGRRTCAGSLKVEENSDPRGNPGMLPCASTDAELAGLYLECMEPDLSLWREQKPLTRQHIEQFLERWALYNIRLMSFILIHNNTWYYPFHSSWNHTQEAPTKDWSAAGITPWITNPNYYFHKFKLEIPFPDVFFFMSDQDIGFCEDPSACAIPSLSITKKMGPDSRSSDLLFPFMAGIEWPLFNYPSQLKEERAFFVGRPNWGQSGKQFSVSGGTQEFFSRQHLANLSVAHPDVLYSALLSDQPERYPGALTTKQEVLLRDHARWRFLLHLDGITYAYRLSRLMHTNSVVLKEETNWPEYFVRALKPGEHYLPIFKTGPDDVLDVVRQWRDRPLELNRIAFNAQQFALRYLCPRARVLYLRRLLTEYRALFDDVATGRNHLQDFIQEAILPIIEARKRGDMEFTYRGIKPWLVPR